MTVETPQLADATGRAAFVADNVETGATDAVSLECGGATAVEAAGAKSPTSISANHPKVHVASKEDIASAAGHLLSDSRVLARRAQRAPGGGPTVHYCVTAAQPRPM